jgi:hypothetical protein
MKRLDDLSEEMTQAGDLWREFAITAARIYKKRCSADQQTFDQAADKLLKIADREEATFKKLAELQFDWCIIIQLLGSKKSPNFIKTRKHFL